MSSKKLTRVLAVILYIILFREDYDAHLNQISVSVLFGSHYTVTDGMLILKQVNITSTL